MSPVRFRGRLNRRWACGPPCNSQFACATQPDVRKPRAPPTTRCVETQAPEAKTGAVDKLFWVVARHIWSDWKKSLLLVLPETVARWHQAGFKLYWTMLCKVRKRVGGGRRISKQIRELIFLMVAENPTWGAPRIHGELLMLGFHVSETTVSRWMRQAPRKLDPGKRWLAFLRTRRSLLDGFLHGPDTYIQRTLLLLHHQPRP